MGMFWYTTHMYFDQMVSPCSFYIELVLAEAIAKDFAYLPLPAIACSTP